MKKAILTGLTAAMLSTGALASEVTAGVDTTTFTSSTPALASEVNANFAALIAAINDNDARIAALEAASGGGGDLTSVVSGSSYQVFFSGGIINRYSDALSPYTGAEVERFGGNSVITFHSDGTLSELFSEVGRHISLEKEVNCDEFGGNCEHDGETWEDTDQASGPGGAWSVSGQTLTVLWPGDSPGDEEEFLLSAAGTVIILGGGGRSIDTDEFGTQDAVETFLAVGVKLTSAE